MKCSRTLLVAISLLLLSPLAGAQSRYPNFGLPPVASNSQYVRLLLTAVDPRERIEAARRLGRTGDVRVIESLSQAAVFDTDAGVRREASEAIQRIRQQTGTGVVPGPADPGAFPGFRPPMRPPVGDPRVELIQSYYQRYLKRSADWGGLQNWLIHLQRGLSPEQVQGAIIGSNEYYRLNGSYPAGFIRALYNDVIGRSPSPAELRSGLENLNRLRNNRAQHAEEFIRGVQGLMWRDFP